MIMMVMRRKKITSGRCRRWNGDADDNYNDDDDSGDEDVEDGTEMHDLSVEPRAEKLSTNCFKLTF